MMMMKMVMTMLIVITFNDNDDQHDNDDDHGGGNNDDDSEYCVCTLGRASVSWLGGHLGSQAPPQSYRDSADDDGDYR